MHAPVDDAADRLEVAWGMVMHYLSIADSAQWRAAYAAVQPRVSAIRSQLAQDAARLRHYRALQQSPGFTALSPVRQRVTALKLRDFRLAGAELPTAAAARVRAIDVEMDTLSARFGNNVRDARDAFAEWVIDPARVLGLPEPDLDTARAAAQADGRDGWKFTLQDPSYAAVNQYADDAALREALYRGYQTRASETGPADYDNGPVIEQLLALRGERAALLGFRSHAHAQLSTRMLESPEAALSFLHELNARVAPQLQRELAEFDAFARAQGLDGAQPWDRGYLSRKLREASFGYSDEQLRAYLPADRVLDGLFLLIRRLFGVEIQATDTPVWHPEVRGYVALRDGRELGRFHLDLFARAGKPSGGWMDPWRSRHRGAGGLITPSVIILCNFTAPQPGQPALLLHDDVLTLFHEMGHCLNVLLTRVDERAVSGLNGLEWDAVELASQFMERFVWDWSVLQQITAHVDTGEPLPQALYEQMLAGRRFQSAARLANLIETSVLDLRLHSEFATPGANADIAAVNALTVEVRNSLGAVPRPDWIRPLHALSHLFDGGYSAGYYSYLWSEVMAADVFNALQRTGSLFDANWGEHFVEAFLGRGASRPAAASFQALMGRAPSVAAMLAEYGLSD